MKNTNDIDLKAINNLFDYSSEIKEVTLSDIIGSLPYLIYEFDSKEIDVKNSLGDTIYTKSISPLFSKDVLDNEYNQKFLSIMMDRIPYYYKDPEFQRTEDSVILSETRDSGLNDIPLTLQEDFWFSWTRDTWGGIFNDLILDTYNKLKYSLVNENVYLNAKLLPTLSENFFYDEGATKETKGLITFKNSDEDNDLDNDSEGKIGNIDYLNNIIEQKLSSVYKIIDYTPNQADLLLNWGDSLFWSGRVTEDELSYEKEIYKLQDIQYELLRRKFAGSQTLYSIALSSISRRGSFVPVVSASRIEEINKSRLFKDTRLIRLLNIPGLLSTYADLTSTDPLKSLYLTPYNEGSSYIPLDTVVPLYYDSVSYNAKDFYNYGNISSDIVNINYRNTSLRDNVTDLDWEALIAINSSESISYTYFTLDNGVQIEGSIRYTKLDDKPDYTGFEIDESIKPYVNNNYWQLDVRAKNTSTSYKSENILDISANKLLYNENTIQKYLQSTYPYVTYAIANNNSISLMDTYWISYIESSTVKKSRVQESIKYGTQLSLYYKVNQPSNQKVSNFCYCISYSNSSSVEDETYDLSHFEDSKPIYAYLWFCILKVNISTSKVVSVEKKLISRITLNNSELYDRESDEEYMSLLSKYNIGLLPFTYEELYLNNFDISTLKCGYDEDSKFIESFTDSGLTTAFFAFSDSDILKNYANTSEYSGEVHTYGVGRLPLSKLRYTEMSLDPSEDTKVVYFILPRYNDNFRNEEGLTHKVDIIEASSKNSDGTYEDSYTYYWSNPIRVIPLSEVENADTLDSSIKADYDNLDFFLNTYLNFTSDSASPLRNKKVLPSLAYKNSFADATKAETYLEGAGEYTSLCNINRARRRDFLCADDGKKKPTLWSSDYTNHTNRTFNGYYLNRVQATTESSRKVEKVIISGDNRFSDSNDSFSLDGSLLCEDSLGMKCIKFTKNTSNTTLVDNNYYEIVPCKGYTNSDFTNWYWNRTSDGIGLFLNIRLDSNVLNQLNNTTPISSTLLKRDGEFSLELCKYSEEVSTQDDEEQEQETKYFNIKFTYKGVTVESSPIGYTYSENSVVDFPKYNFRIGASAKEGESSTCKVILSVNNDISTKEGSYTTTSSSSTKVISLLRDFYGYLYDLRLYKRSFSKIEHILFSCGSFRELYSYSPDNYKLSYNVYLENGILKVKNTFTNDNSLKVTKLRIFNRSVWDSILLDMYPTPSNEGENSSEYYYYTDSNTNDYRDAQDDIDIFKYDSETEEYNLNDCIQHVLTQGIEAYNGVQPFLKGAENRCNVTYRGKTYNVGDSDTVTVLTTLLYPIEYRNALFASAEDGINSAEISVSNGKVSTVEGINIPASEIGKTLAYNASLIFNFKASCISDFSTYYSKGSNISLLYNKSLNKSVVSLIDTTVRDSNSNHLLIPLTIPKQDASLFSSSSFIYLDRFYVRGIQLNTSLCELLSASSYYNELKIPTLVWTQLGGDPSYIDKWSGIRVLKEGSYFITCKYPLKILPFLDSDFSIKSASTYNTLYGSVRFKIVVKGSTIKYDSSKYKTEGVPSKYLLNNYRATLSSDEGLVHPSDNKTFPHRVMNIDLYVMDVNSGIAGILDSYDKETYSFTWKLIASNHDTSEGVVTLDSKTLASPIVITKDIPIFFSKNYSLPFFISETEKKLNGSLEYNPLSADDDLIYPIRVYPRYSEENILKERLNVMCESDLDNIYLVGGRNYKVLFDYSAKITEFSFLDSYYSSIESEKKEYSRAVNLLNADFEASTYEYMYDKAVPWHNSTDIAMRVAPSGFITTNSGFESVGEDTDGNYSLGNPYSRSSEKNHLLYLNQNSRMFVNSMYAIPYIPEGIPSGRKDINCIYSKGVYVMKATSNNTYSTAYLDNFNEYSSIDNCFLFLKERAKSSIRSLSSSILGVFTNISEVYPYLNNDTQLNDIVNVSKIYSNYNELFGYHASLRTIPVRDENIYISRRGVYSNNMIQSQDFSNKTYWVSSPKGYYTSDNSWDNGVGKDIYAIDIPSNGSATVRYTPKETAYKSKYEVAINLKVEDNKELIESIDNLKVSANLLEVYDNITISTKTMELHKDGKSQDKSSFYLMFTPNLNSGGTAYESYTVSLYKNGSKVTSSLYAKYWFTTSSGTKSTETSATVTNGSITVTIGQRLSDKLTVAFFSDADFSTLVKEDSLDLNDSSWYVYSAETNEIQGISSDGIVSCNCIEYKFENNSSVDITLYITKAVVRTSETIGHYLGLSDALHISETSSDNVYLSPHSIIFFKHTLYNNIVPIKFLNSTRKYVSSKNYSTESFYIEKSDYKVRDLINEYSLGYTNDPKMESLIYPWERKIYFDEDGKNNESGETISKAYFHSFKVGTDIYGIKSKKENNLESKDVFSNVGTWEYEDSSNLLKFSNMVLNMDSSNSLLGYLNMDLDLLDGENETAISLVDEHFSLISNCFNLNKYKLGQSSPIAVTNIQLIAKDETTQENINEYPQYEIEFFPIIYDEVGQHVSLNLFLHTGNN